MRDDVEVGGCAERDPVTLAWSDEPLYPLSTELVLPADPPPWWRVGKKASNFANGMSRRDHRGTMVLASFRTWKWSNRN